MTVNTGTERICLGLLMLIHAGRGFCWLTRLMGRPLCDRVVVVVVVVGEVTKYTRRLFDRVSSGVAW